MRFSFCQMAHTVFFYGCGLYRAFRGHFAGVTRPRVLLLVLCWSLGLVQVVNAEWGTDDRQLLQKIGGDLEQDIKPDLRGIKTNTGNTLSEIQKYLPNLPSIHQDLLSIQQDLGVNSGIPLSESLRQIRDAIGIATSSTGGSVNQQLQLARGSLSSIHNLTSDFYASFGYTGVKRFSNDMGTVISKLESIRSALASGSGGGGGLTSDELANALRFQFGQVFANSSVSVHFWRASGSEFISDFRNVVGFPSLFSLLNDQLVETSKAEMNMVQSVVGILEQYICDLPDTQETIISLLEDIKQNSANGSSGGGGGLTLEELETLLVKHFGTSDGSFFDTLQNNDTTVNGMNFWGLTNHNNGGRVKNVLDALRVLQASLVHGLDSSTKNQQLFAQLFWQGLIGASSGSSSSTAFEFLSDVFRAGDPFYDGGKSFRSYFDTDKFTPHSILEALMVLNNNVTRGTYVASENALAQGDLTYWATTNIVSRIDPNAYWGNSEDELSSLQTNKTFQVSVDDGKEGSSSSSPESYEPAITNDLGVVHVAINDNTNKVYQVRSEEIQARYLRNPFGESSSSDQIDSVEGGGFEKLEIGGVLLDFEESYNLFKTNFLSTVAPPVKKGFGFLWVFLAVLFSSIAIRKCVTGGV